MQTSFTVIKGFLYMTATDESTIPDKGNNHYYMTVWGNWRLFDPSDERLTTPLSDSIHLHTESNDSLMSGWIGVDLDGTLAKYSGKIDGVGEAIEPMANRIRAWLKDGRTVKIFTARVATEDPVQIKMIQDFCLNTFGQILEVTCRKDYGMIELWDDRAIQVIPNTGKRVDGVKE